MALLLAHAGTLREGQPVVHLVAAASVDGSTGQRCAAQVTAPKAPYDSVLACDCVLPSSNDEQNDTSQPQLH